MPVRLTIEQFINKSNKIHDYAYDYSLTEYRGAHNKVKIICKKHGIFEQIATDHCNTGCGCPECSNVKPMNSFTFSKRASLIHKEKYDYSLVEYKNAFTKVKIICKKHGIFEQKPDYHLYSKSGCPKCKTSKGELKIIDFLEQNNIKFEQQKWFNDCRDKLPLKFDFYLPTQNIFIEYDGEQHFMPWRKTDKAKIKLKITQKRDKIKDCYCKNNNLTLIRISYKNFNNINKILSNVIFKDEETSKIKTIF